MAFYTYDGQRLIPCEPRVPWPDDAGLDDWVALSGFRFGGGEDMAENSFVIFPNADETAFLVDFAPFRNWCHYVYVDSFPDLMTFMRDVVHPAVMREMADELREMRSLAEKAFRVLHGHGPVDTCMACDPIEYTQRLSRRMARS